MTSRKPKLTRDNPIEFPVPGTLVTVTLTQGVDCYTVTTTSPAGSYDRWCGQFLTEADARKAAAHVTKAFAAHGSEPAIDRRRDQLCFDLNVETRRPTRQQNKARIAAIEAELETLLDLHTLRLEGHLVADVTAFLAA